MKPLLPVLLLLLLPAPAPAQILPAFAGHWQGEGALTRGAEPPQRFRCQLQLRPRAAGQGGLTGRCATAQAQQSFAWLLREAADGTLDAEDTGPTPVDELPDRMQGRAAPGLLQLGDPAGAFLELRLDGSALHFTVAAQDDSGPVRGEALLQRRD